MPAAPLRLLAILVLACLSVAWAQHPPRFRRIQVSTSAAGTSLTVFTTGPFAESAYHPSAHLLLVDLHNVALAKDQAMVKLPHGPVATYRLYTYHGAGKQDVLRLEVGIRSGASPHVRVAGNRLLLEIDGPGNVVASSRAAAGKPHPSAPARVASAHAPAAPASGHTATAAADRPGQLTRVQVSSSSRGVVVLLRTSHPSPEWKTFTLRRPDRLVVDLPGMVKGVSRGHWTVGASGLKDVRAAQFNATVVRVVFDLDHPVTPIITHNDGVVRVVIPAQPITARGAAPKRPQANKVHEAKAAFHPVRHAPAPIRFKPAVMIRPRMARHAAEPRAAAPPVVRLASARTLNRPAPEWLSHPAPEATHLVPPPPAPAPAPRPVMARMAPRPVAAAPVADLPAAAPTPVPVADPPTATPAAMPAAAAPPVAERAYTPRGQAPASLNHPLDSEVDHTAGSVPYTGQRISLNLKNADIKDFFRLVHEISGLNIVVDPNVKGTVTMVVDDIPWDQALDLVLRNNQLGRQLEGNVVRIATLKTLQTEAAEQAQLTAAQENAVPLVTEVKSLSYAKATSLVNTLKQFVGARGDITPDARTNTLIIQTLPDKLPLLNRLIARLDQKTPQVEVEARVVAASRNFSRELGVQLGFGLGNSTTSLGGNPAVGGSPTVLGGLQPKYPLTTNGGLPLNANLPVGAASSGLGFISATNSYRIDALLSAAEQKGLGHVLSRPKVITQNNAQAIVQQGVKIPVQTTINNTISVQFFNVTLRLAVTPQITADNTVFLQVDIENDQIDPGIPRIQGVPAIDTQSTTTNVLVRNGATVVVGGVMINNSQNNVQQVPMLGSLPVVGNLFKHTSIQNNSQELLFFLTPRILPS